MVSDSPVDDPRGPHYVAKVPRGRLVVVGVLVVLVTSGIAAAAPGSQLRPYQAIDVGSWPAAVAVGDVTGDGRRDVVMTTGFYFDPANDHRVWVFAQTSDGNLAAPVSYSAGVSSDLDSVAVGDITGDGRADVVVGVTDTGVQVFPQQDSGALGPPSLYPTSNGRQVRLGYLDADSRLDVAALGWGTNTVSVLLNDGAGGLQTPVEYLARHAGYDDLEIGDVTGDSRADLVVMSGQGLVPNLSVLPRLPAGGFGPAAEYSVGGNSSTGGIGVGDVTGDGLNDVVASYGGNRPYSNVAVFAQTASGTLTAPTSYASYDIPEPVDVADMDLDGRADVVTLHGGWSRAGLYRQQPAGGLAPEDLYAIPYASHYEPHGLALGDVNGDGSPDVVLADYNNGLVVLRNSTSVPPPPPPSADVAVGLVASGTKAKPRKSFWIDATVYNAGPNASSATLVVQLAGAASGYSENSSSCALQGSTVTCSFAGLGTGSSATVRVSGVAGNKGTITASAAVDGALADPNSRNDQASLSIQVR
jgi:hypothetical protein